MGGAKREQLGKYLNGKTLSIAPNWFGEFGGCVLSIDWGHLGPQYIIRLWRELHKRKRLGKPATYFIVLFELRGEMLINQKCILLEKN